MRMFLTAILAFAGLHLSAYADALDRIEANGEIRLGIRADAPPFSYLNAETEPAGLAVRLCEEVARRIGKTLGHDPISVNHKIVNAASRFPALDEGLTDLHCGPATVTLQRREKLDFSVLFFVDGAAIAERRGGYEAVMADKRGSIGAVEGTTTMAIVQAFIAEHSLETEIRAFPSHTRGLKALHDGDIDLYVGDRAIVLFQIGLHGFFDRVSVRPEVLSYEPYALAMRGGERRLQLAVDRALSQIYEEGQIFEMIQAELGNFEISDQTRALYDILSLPN